MVTENVDIRFRETGARVIKRRIDDIGLAANSATRGIFLMQRALFVLGGAGLLRGLTRQLDTLTEYENRLRLTAKSAQNLEVVQRRLFQVARDSRTSFEAVADIYSRTALSVRELGISQAETLRFSESLSKATIISGASAREAHAALVQLGQGMASNTLRGDELRSVLEQLPFVADVISKSLGVTRGELRELGAEGKISAETILTAFRDAEAEIDQLFANTMPTISQALSVASSNWLEFLDGLDDATNGSAKLAKAIIVISENIALILGTIGTLTLALAVIFTGKAVSGIANYIVSLRAAALRATRLLEIESLRAASSVRNNAAQVAQNAQRQVELSQRLALLGIQKAQLQQTVLDTQFTVVNGQARNIATGQFVSLTAAKANLSRVTQQLSIVENIELTTAGRLTGARVAQTGATTALAGANVRLASAQVAQGAIAARLTAMFPVMAGAVGRVVASLSSLAAFIGPIGLIATAIGAAVAVFTIWGNQIKVTTDGVVGLRDFVVAAFQLMSEAIAPVIILLREGIGKSIDSVLGFFDDLSAIVLKVMKFIIRTTYETFTFVPRLVVSVITGIIATFRQLGPGAGSALDAVVDVFVTGFEAVANIGVAGVQKIIDAFNSLAGTTAGDWLGLSQIDALEDINLDRLRTSFGDGGVGAGEAFAEGFTRSWEATSFDAAAETISSSLKPLNDAIIARARANIAEALAEASARNSEIDLVNPDTSPLSNNSGAGSEKNFAAIISGMEREIDLLKLTNEERTVLQGILKIEEELKRNLTDQENLLAIATLRSLEVAKAASSVYEEIKGPLDSYAISLEALYLLLDTGRISQDAFNVSLASLNQTILETMTQSGDGTFVDGFLLGISRMTEGVRTFAASSGEVFSDFFSSLTDGFADSVGKAIVFSEDLGQALKSVAQNALASLISGLVKMGTQWLLNAALGKSISAAATAASAATAATTAAAWAPAAALASLATLGTNAAAASAGIASTVALSTALASAGGFADGGLVTGPGGPREDKIPAMLSNKEFVVNAEATAKNLSLLRAINSGANVSNAMPSFASGGMITDTRSSTPTKASSPMKVSVHNYTGQNVKVEKVSENEIRIIAGEEAEKKVSERTPEIVAGQLADPNSQISSSIAENTTAERRR